MDTADHQNTNQEYDATPETGAESENELPEMSGADYLSDPVELDELETDSSEDYSGTDAISLYLREISQYPLLDREEEIALSKAIIEQGSPEARERLIHGNLRLVVAFAKRYADRGIPLLDLIQEGNFGLTVAAERYDYRKEAKFSTFAIFWIKHYVEDYIQNNYNMVRVPPYSRAKYNNGIKKAKQAAQEESRNVTVQDLEDNSELPRRVVGMISSARAPTLSLDQATGPDEDSLLELIPDTGKSVERMVQTGLTKEFVEKAIRDVPVKERIILKLKFGMADEIPYTLEEIGREFGLTRERVRQLADKGLNTIKARNKEEILREYSQPV